MTAVWPGPVRAGAQILCERFRSIVTLPRVILGSCRAAAPHRLGVELVRAEPLGPRGGLGGAETDVVAHLLLLEDSIGAQRVPYGSVGPRHQAGCVHGEIDSAVGLKAVPEDRPSEILREHP